MKFTHIAFGDSAGGCLKYFLSTNSTEYSGEVISLRDLYTVGPIKEIDTCEGMKKRIEWIDNLLKEVCFYEDFGENFQEVFYDIEETYKRIRGIDGKVIIWHGEITMDQVALRFLMSLLKTKDIYEVNVSQLEMQCGHGKVYNPRALGECRPEDISKLIPLINKISNKRLKDLSEEWNSLRESDENLRIFENGNIKGVEESYYDKLILDETRIQGKLRTEECTQIEKISEDNLKNYVMAARVVGCVMGKSDQVVGDTYLDSRVRKLIEMGKLKYRGKLKMLRDYEIALT